MTEWIGNLLEHNHITGLTFKGLKQLNEELDFQ